MQVGVAKLSIGHAAGRIKASEHPTPPAAGGCIRRRFQSLLRAQICQPALAQGHLAHNATAACAILNCDYGILILTNPDEIYMIFDNGDREAP
jgi:hypothetical protein